MNIFKPLVFLMQAVIKTGYESSFMPKKSICYSSNTDHPRVYAQNINSLQSKTIVTPFLATAKFFMQPL